MKQPINKAFFILFVLVWGGLCLFNVITPEVDFSENENRMLSDVPQFSAEKLIDGSFMSKLDTYVNEQFVLRDSWINAMSAIEYVSGKREINGVFVGSGMLLDTADSVDEGIIDKNIDGMNAFAQAHDLACYLMLVPSSAEIEAEKLPPFAPKTDEKTLISDIYGRAEGVKPIDIYDILYERRNDYIYYRTDHHWTSYGAYLAYEKWCEATENNASVYNAETISENFNGTYFSTSGVRFIESDTIEAYKTQYDNGIKILSDAEETEYDSIFFPEYIDKKDKYSYFLGKIEPIVTLYGNSNLKKKLLLFKDSYSHCFVPMLLEYYSEITMLDMRYINIPIDELIDVAQYSDALFLYSTDTFTSTVQTALLK